LAWTRAPAVVPYLMLHFFSFGFISAWGLYEKWQIRHNKAHEQHIHTNMAQKLETSN
jgi:hypothetical protein